MSNEFESSSVDMDFECCFCRARIGADDLTLLVRFNDAKDLDHEATQQLYCHRDCLRSVVDQDVPLLHEADDSPPIGPTLSMPLDTTWRITLVGGDVVQVNAHGYGDDGDNYEFEMLVEGRPRRRAKVVSLPKSLVESIRSD